jgi:two-component system, chemotaxis family, protein-glutamate methylesterase/glutaminase
VIAASAGGFPAVSRLIGALSPSLDAAVIVVQHRAATRFPIYQRLLHRWSSLPVVGADEGVAIRPGRVYVAPADHHLVIADDRTFRHRDGTRIKGTLSSANPLLESASRVYGRDVVAVILTGSGSDGVDGVQSVKGAGGIVIAEHGSTAPHPSMPLAAQATGAVDFVLPLPEIAPALMRLIDNNQGVEPATAT